MLTDDEMDVLVANCQEVPLTSSIYRSENEVHALLETVVDYQMHKTAVRRALEYFREERSAEIRAIGDLETCAARFPDTKEGNLEFARYLRSRPEAILWSDP